MLHYESVPFGCKLHFLAGRMLSLLGEEKNELSIVMSGRGPW